MTLTLFWALGRAALLDNDPSGGGGYGIRGGGGGLTGMGALGAASHCAWKSSSLSVLYRCPPPCALHCSQGATSPTVFTSRPRPRHSGGLKVHATRFFMIDPAAPTP